eukprot:13121425-Alexandrium_andersonii.AAC.1
MASREAPANENQAGGSGERAPKGTSPARPCPAVRSVRGDWPVPDTRYAGLWSAQSTLEPPAGE